jgi:hypothetical protein
MSDAEKLAKYEKILTIIDAHLALWAHQKEVGTDLRDMEASKADAYRQIVIAIRGFDAPGML